MRFLKAGILILITVLSQKTMAQCGSCTNPTGIVSVGFGESICYDANTTITSLTVFFDGAVTICDGVTLTVTGQTQLSGTAQVYMNNCSEIDMIGSFTNSVSNVFVYQADSTCDARVTIHSSSDLSTLTNNSKIHFCNLNNSAVTGTPGLATVGCGLPLPIELASFNASLTDNNAVALNWETISESNNDYFTIERSADGHSWKALENIDGAGNSSDLLAYNAIDESPYNGTSYYRLKQTDFDGRYAYSQVKTAQINKPTIHVYPNPAQDRIVIEGTAPELEQLALYNQLGQDITASVRVVTDHQNKKVIDLSNLNTGAYFIRTKSIHKTLYKE